MKKYWSSYIKIHLGRFVLLLGVLSLHIGCENKSGLTEVGTGPAIRFTNPDRNATEVSVGILITAEFDDEMNPATITDSSFTLKMDTLLVNGSINYADSTATFTPSKNLTFGQSYTATITTQAQNLAGTSMNKNYEWDFTTVEHEADTLPPQIISTTPSHDEEKVSISTSISATFNEAVKQSTISDQTFSLRRGSNAISGSYSFSGNSITFTPSDDLLFERKYTATITGDVEDLAGNKLSSNVEWSFITMDEPDKRKPEIASKSPGSKQKGVDIKTDITVVFNEAMDPQSINGSSFALQVDGASISGNYTHSGNTATLNPSDDLLYQTTYTVILTTGITDLAGNGLSQLESWQFETEKEPDTIAPQINTIAPENDETNVPLDVIILVTFSEPMNPATIDEASFILSRAGDKIKGDVAMTSATTARFTPDKKLELGTTYRVTISDEIEDLAGNNMNDDQRWSFTTEQESVAPKITSTSPPNQANRVPVDVVISATFNELMNPFSINENTFTLREGDKEVEGRISFLLGNTPRFIPDQELDYSANYTAIITSEVTDLAGNNMEKDYRWDFRTESKRDDDD